jgi:hypothetical protein
MILRILFRFLKALLNRNSRSSCERWHSGGPAQVPDGTRVDIQLKPYMRGLKELTKEDFDKDLTTGAARELGLRYRRRYGDFPRAEEKPGPESG